MIVRPLDAGDWDAWAPLWRGYLRFYRARMGDDIGRIAFERLTGPREDMAGFVAEAEGALIGFVNLVTHASTWTPAGVCYLQDLFVDGAARGHGAGRALIEAVYHFADERGLGGVYWHTQEFNADARALYDTLAARTSFVQYQRR
jgi:GNAT superfamily N-acetyltransferase